MLIPNIFVAMALPFAGMCAVFAVYMCLVHCAMRRTRRAAAEEVTKKASKGLPKSELEKLPVTKAGEEGWECSVCLESVERGQRIRVLPICKHSFHVPCVDRWLAGNAVCPVCRTCLLTPAVPMVVVNGDDNC